LAKGESQSTLRAVKLGRDTLLYPLDAEPREGHPKFPKTVKLAWLDGFALEVGARSIPKYLGWIEYDKRKREWQWSDAFATGVVAVESFPTLREAVLEHSGLARDASGKEWAALDKMEARAREELDDEPPSLLSLEFAQEEAEEADDADLVLSYSWDEGILVCGSTRAWKETIKGARVGGLKFRFSRNLPGDCAWYIPRTRDKAVDRELLEQAAKDMRSAGVKVAVRYTEPGERPSFSEQEAARAERAGERLERLETRRDRLEGEASKHLAAASMSEATTGIPLGQPILVGHHSEGKHRRTVERAQRRGEKFLETTREAEQAGSRLEGATHREAMRTDPAATIRRIGRLDVELRQVKRNLYGHPGSGTTLQRGAATGSYQRQLEGLERDLEEKLAHWREQLEGSGVKLWGPDDFEPGDGVEGEFGWAVVQRVNKKTLTVANTKPALRDLNPHKLAYNRVAGKVPVDDQALLDDVAEHPGATVDDVAGRLGWDRRSVEVAAARLIQQFLLDAEDGELTRALWESKGRRKKPAAPAPHGMSKQEASDSVQGGTPNPFYPHRDSWATQKLEAPAESPEEMVLLYLMRIADGPVAGRELLRMAVMKTGSARADFTGPLMRLGREAPRVHWDTDDDTYEYPSHRPQQPSTLTPQQLEGATDFGFADSLGRTLERQGLQVVDGSVHGRKNVLDAGAVVLSNVSADDVWEWLRTGAVRKESTPDESPVPTDDAPAAEVSSEPFPPLKMYTSYHFGTVENQRGAIRYDNNGYLALTPTQSKTFKKQAGAERWLLKRIGPEKMVEARLDVPDDSAQRVIKRGDKPASKPKRGPLKPKPPKHKPAKSLEGLSVPMQRKQLRQEAQDRHKATVPKLKTAVKTAKTAKAKRVKAIQNTCIKRRVELQADVKRARGLLRLGIQAARKQAREACSACKVTATATELDALDKALQSLEKQRESISDLRRRADSLKSERGRAGGRRAAEVREESDSLVRNNLDGDLVLLAVWERVKHKIKPTDKMSRTEAFLQYVHDHGEEVDAQHHIDQARWDTEAGTALKELEGAKYKTEAQFDAYVARLEKADQLLEQDVPF